MIKPVFWPEAGSHVEFLWPPLPFHAEGIYSCCLNTNAVMNAQNKTAMGRTRKCSDCIEHEIKFQIRLHPGAGFRLTQMLSFYARPSEDKI